MPQDDSQSENLVRNWAEAFAQAKETSPELTWRAGRAAIKAAQEAAGGPSGFGTIIEKTLVNLPEAEMTWGGARNALQGLIKQLGELPTAKMPDTREDRIQIVQSALAALDHEMKVSQARVLQR